MTSPGRLQESSGKRVRFFIWLRSAEAHRKLPDGQCERLVLTLRVTATARYAASVRLRFKGKIAFATTIALSLGLIFIPLLQNAAVPLAVGDKALNAMQVFLAVSTLVYSVVIGSAAYELRAEQLNECGDKLKALTRDVERELEYGGGTLPKEMLERFEQRYQDIITDTENHTRNDYRRTVLDMRSEFTLTGLPRMWQLGKYQLVRASAIIIPLILLGFEALFITDMLGITAVISPYLNGKYVSA